MCGIVGYIGKKDVKSVLLTGLKALEYRGYDSAGIALRNDEKIQIIKSVGRIKNLEEKLTKTKIIKATSGIAHTRWATHGKANETNAHPHQVGKITLVHNGIIENMDELKTRLIKKGYSFKTETDTEVVAALIDSYLNGDILKAIKKATNDITGSYALGIISETDKDHIYAIRKDSPLLLGLKEDENFFASDLTALTDYTDKFIFLEEGEIAKLSSNQIVIYDSNLKPIKKEIKTIKLDEKDKGKQGYEHFMLKEIMEESIVLEKTIKKYLENPSLLPDLNSYKQIHIVACGSAMYAGLIAKYLIEKYASIPCQAEVASEYRYKNNIYDRKTLVILISQSGETADTIAAMREAKKRGITTMAIVNVKTSTIAREADIPLFIEAGPEIAVATTKAYLLQVALISLIAFNLSKHNLKEPNKIIEDFKKVPRLVKEIIDKRENYQDIAKQIYQNENAFFIGRQIDYAICQEGSLKLKEVSYIHCEAKEAGELKHGTISLITKDMPVFGIITDENLRDKTLANIKEVESRGAKTFIITTDKLKTSENDITVKATSPFTETLEVVPILQLIAYETAKLRGCDIDKPKNLAKSVTVE